MGQLEVHLIPAFQDNYLFVGHNRSTGQVFAVDPGDADPVLQFLSEKNWKLNAILATHHHHDHIGGISQLKSQFACNVYGPMTENPSIPDLDHAVREGDKITFGQLQCEILDLKGHTASHLGYYFKDEKSLFLGDVLFNLGCGRVFPEGSLEDSYDSLQKLKTLPPETKIYCAHEYSITNCRFVKSLKPAGQILLEYEHQLLELRKKNQPTVPFTLASQIQLNPFLTAKTFLEFKQLRLLRNQF